MELRLGVIIFITVSLHFKASTSVKFSLFSYKNLSNFLENLIVINKSLSNSTTEIMLDTVTEIKNTLHTAADKGVNLVDSDAKLEWFYPLQSEEDMNNIRITLEYCATLNSLFERDFLPLLNDFNSNFTEYQLFNLSEDFNKNFFLLNSHSSLRNMNEIVFFETDLKNTTLIERMVNEMNIDYNSCKSVQNHQLLLSTFYEYVMKAELRAVTMNISAYKLITAKTKVFTAEVVQNMENACILKWPFFLKTIKNNLNKLSTNISNCELITSEAFLSEVHIINLLPIHSHYTLNKAIIKIGLQVSSSILTLRIVDAPILPYGEVVEDTREHQLIVSNNIDYWNPFNEFDEDVDSESNDSCPTVADISKGFWENIKFLPTTVPKGCVVVGAKIEILHVYTAQTRLIYLRLQYANYNHTDGKIDPDSVQFTKLWTNDDPELTKLLTTEVIDASFKKDIEIPDTDERGNQKIERLPDNFRIRMRQEQYINYRIDCDSLSPGSLKPLTGLSFWKSNRRNKNIYHLSLEALQYNLSENIDI